MSGFSAWIGWVCVAAAVGGLVRILMPSGSMGPTLRWVAGLFCLGCFLLPLRQMKEWPPSVSLSFEPLAVPTALAEHIQADWVSETEERLRPVVEQAVKEQGATLIKFRLITDSDGTFGIDITEAEVVLKEGDALVRESLQKELSDSLGVTVWVR